MPKMPSLPEPECVKMKRRASLRIHKMLSKMTREEEIAYWDARVKEMIEAREKAIEKARKESAAGSRSKKPFGAGKGGADGPAGRRV